MTITRIGQLTADMRFTGAFITNGSTVATISSTKAYTGTFSYAFTATTNPAGLGLSAATEIRASAFVNHNSVTGVNARAYIFDLFFTSSNFHRIAWDQATGNLQMYVSGTLVASIAASSVSFNTVNTWMQVAITFKADATNGYFSFYLNGTLVLSYTGNTGASGVNNCYYGGTTNSNGGWTSTAYFDDFYVDTTVGEGDSSPSGRRFYYNTTSGAGTNAAFTPVGAGSNYQTVQDAVQDGDTTINKALSASLKDTFQMVNQTIISNYVIRAMIPIGVVRKTDAGLASQIRFNAYDGSSYENGSDLSLGTTYAIRFERFELQPDSTAWNETDANAMEFGYESRGTF